MTAPDLVPRGTGVFARWITERQYGTPAQAPRRASDHGLSWVGLMALGLAGTPTEERVAHAGGAQLEEEPRGLVVVEAAEQTDDGRVIARLALQLDRAHSPVGAFPAAFLERYCGRFREPSSPELSRAVSATSLSRSNSLTV